jgi:hypothetical protein
MGVAPGIYVDATAREGWMHGFGGWGAVQAERGEEILGRLLELPDRRISVVGYGLARANDHGINRVESDGEQHPEDRGEEKAAHDLAYGMGLKEAG